MFRIALFSMPWPLFNRPSLQLGSLKSYLRLYGNNPDVSAYPVYLEVASQVGFKLYDEISKHRWLAEAMYAPLLFPEKESSVRALIARQKKSLKCDGSLELSTLESKLIEHHKKLLHLKDWGRYNLMGFSICLNQLTSSLHAIRAFKAKFPELHIVAGGSSCSGEMGQTLLANCPEIDFVVSGEGEKPLLSIVRFLQGTINEPGPGVFYRDSEGMVTGGGYDEIYDLDSLPPPDYEDYFKYLYQVSPQIPFRPVLPLEFSRGCWWKKCRFCNLNLQWHSYRKKSLNRMIKEIKTLTDHYPSIDLAFTDNTLPSQQVLELFADLSRLRKDFDIFAELRAEQTPDELYIMRKAGLKNIQVGIEALSSSLLKRMGKGTTAIQNIEIMRHCEELGIIQSGNLITRFPGSTPDEVKETIHNLDYTWVFYPLKITPFWLGYGSPVFNEAQELGLKKRGNHHNYKYFLPHDLFSQLTLIHQDYQGDKSVQYALWKPVIEKVKRWRKHYFYLRSRYPSVPLLSYRDGGKFLFIRQMRPDGQVQIHRLYGSSRSIYLYCTSTKSLKEIKEKFSSHSLEALNKFLDDLVQKRIMLKEGKQYLSLAIREEGARE